MENVETIKENKIITHKSPQQEISSFNKSGHLLPDLYTTLITSYHLGSHFQACHVPGFRINSLHASSHLGPRNTVRRQTTSLSDIADEACRDEVIRTKYYRRGGRFYNLSALFHSLFLSFSSIGAHS